MSPFPSFTAQPGPGTIVLNLGVHISHPFLPSFYYENVQICSKIEKVLQGIPVPAKPPPKSAINSLLYLLYHRSVFHELKKYSSYLWVVPFSPTPFWLSGWLLHGTCSVRVIGFSCQSYLPISLSPSLLKLSVPSHGVENHPWVTPGMPPILTSFGLCSTSFSSLLFQVPHLLGILNIGGGR